MLRLRPLLPLVALAGLAVACSRAPEAPALPYYDLAERAESAGMKRQTSAVPFGRPEARPYLESGWHAPEVDKRRKRPFVWSSGDESALRIQLLNASDIEVRFDVRPAALEAEEPQAITVVANGKEAGTVELRRGVHSYTVTLPGEALLPGENRLAFRYRHIREPTSSSGESRRLAVAWYDLFLAGGTGAPAEPAARVEGASLFLPFGSQLTYLVRLEPETELRIDRLAFRGSAGRVEVWLHTDLEEPRQIARLDEGGEGATIAIPVDSPTPANLVLRAAAESSAPTAEAGVILERAALWSRDPARQAQAWRGERDEDARRPDIFIYLVDTLRSDRLGVYGYDRGLSPRLDAFAEEAVVFERAVGQSSWTRASIASIFTGLWPHTHGAVGRRDRLADDAVTLAEVLKEGGYQTVAFATNPNIDERFGFSQGFDLYFHARSRTDSPRITARVLAWLDQRDDDRPLFLYVHTVDPHDPYEPPAEYLERFAPDSAEFLKEEISKYRRRERWEPTEETLRHLNQLYDAEVAFNDHSFGVFLDELRQRGLYDDSILAFVSDHGEEFHDHGNFTHGKTLFAETLDFPFVLRFPGQTEGRRVDSPVQHTDLMPTILDYVGLPIPDAVQGRSLAALADPEFEEPEGPGSRIYSHLDLDGSLTASLVDGDWKLIDWRGRRRSHKILFNLRLDPQETEDLAARYPIRTAVMAAMLEERLAGNQPRLDREEIELDPDLERDLKALGYLQ